MFLNQEKKRGKQNFSIIQYQLFLSLLSLSLSLPLTNVTEHDSEEEGECDDAEGCGVYLTVRGNGVLRGGGG